MSVTTTRIALTTGVQLPQVGLGVYQSPQGAATRNAVTAALELGYRHVDTARIYGNEADVGAAIKASGVPRDHVFVTTKLWNDDHGYDTALRALEASLGRLGLDHVDLYLIHWPFPNFHAPGCDVTSRSPDAKPYIHENFMKTWRKLEELVAKSNLSKLSASEWGTAGSAACGSRLEPRASLRLAGFRSKRAPLANLPRSDSSAICRILGETLLPRAASTSIPITARRKRGTERLMSA
jgi:aryl-alcohol dehydrogenase-like predicted oxidoreductase